MKTVTWPLKCLPKIYLAGRYPMTGRQLRRRYIAQTLALHLHEYGGEIRIGDERFELRPGDVTLTPNGVESFYNLPKAGHHLCIHFFPAANRDEKIKIPLWIRLGSESAFVSQQIWAIIEMHRRAFKPGKAGEIAVTSASAALQSLLLWLYLSKQRPKKAARSSRSEAALQRLNVLIEQRFTEPLTVPQLAWEAGLSQNYLARFFQERYGMTIPRYLLVRRIDLARHLLSTSDDLVKQIAVHVGLPDPQYFNKQFRRLTGSSPSEFRASAIHN